MAGPSIRHRDSDGAAALTVITLPLIVSGVNQQATKKTVESNGTRTLEALTAALADDGGGGDGEDFLRLGLDSVTLSRPFGLAAVLSGTGQGGTWGTTGTRFWVITAINATGETIASDEVSVNVDGVTKKVTLTWTTVAGATGYKVFRSTTSGSYGATSRVATLGVVTTYDDTGTALLTGTPATVNTTGGWKLTATLSGTGQGGTWGALVAYFWRVVARDSTGAAIGVSLEATVTVDEATKKVTLTWPAFAGATTYRVYRSTASGTFASPAVVGTVTAPTATFDDLGAVPTTGGSAEPISYGIPPTLGTTPVTFGNLAVGQQAFYWLNAIVPIATDEKGNPRGALLNFSEA